MRWITAALCAALLVGCGGEEPAAVELPGDYAEIIPAETDCAQLQAIFDTADRAAEGMRERGQIEGTDGAEGFTAVMGAVDERMQELDC